MKILIDADASPVKNEVIQLAEEFQLEVVIVSSISHYTFDTYPDFVKVIYVETGTDRADFKIVQLAQPRDIIVTQDYGLASLLLPKKCRVIHHNSYEYTQENIDLLLHRRHFSALERQSGIRTKGPKAFTDGDRKKFSQFLLHILENS